MLRGTNNELIVNEQFFHFNYLKHITMYPKGVAVNIKHIRV